jgi:transaldolase
MKNNLQIKIFADGADFEEMIKFSKNPQIKGLTTNPSLMKKAGILDYEEFSKKILTHIQDKPISLEVFTDDLKEMERQAIKIASWGSNVYVKIPITNTKKKSTLELAKRLNSLKIKLNITAIFTESQLNEVKKFLDPQIKNYISVFAGRIADTGVNPSKIISKAVSIANNLKNTEVIWASCRELLNIFEADNLGCHIITVPHVILSKLHLVGYDHEEYSLDTVKEFYQDSIKVGYKI